MDALPLPARPNLDHYRKRAKDLVAAVRSSQPGAVEAWAGAWLASLTRHLGVSITPFVQGSIDRAIDALASGIQALVAERSGPESFGLADAQHFIAGAHGFETWSGFAAEVEAHAEPSRGSAFERAADAVVSGDLETLVSLLHEEPALIRARSTRRHHATLLHYVAANGVEDFRQRTPPNAAAVARLLLGAGAEVDAIADCYGGGRDQTTMNLLVSSTHPAEQGVQVALVDTLLDGGAAIEGLGGDGSPLMTALAFGYDKAAEALAARGARVDTVLTAAALGRVDLLERFVVPGARVATGVRLEGPSWLRLPPTPVPHLELALSWAARFGRAQAVALLLDRGVDPAAGDPDRMTALHHAAAGRHLDVVDLLLERGAPLEVTNRWGGTVLDSTVWFARNQPDHPKRRADYGPVLTRLLAAGADARAVELPTGDAALDALLTRSRGG